MKKIVPPTNIATGAFACAMIPFIIAGCTSMQPVDDNTRAFLTGQPGAVCGYKTIVRTKSGKHITFGANLARFDTSNGRKILRAPKDYDGHDPALADTGAWFILPASEIRTIAMDYFINVHTREGAELEADAGDWQFHPAADSGYSWSSQNTMLAANDIQEARFSRFDLGNTMLLSACIIVVWVGMGLRSFGI